MCMRIMHYTHYKICLSFQYVSLNNIKVECGKINYSNQAYKFNEIEADKFTETILNIKSYMLSLIHI